MAKMSLKIFWSYPECLGLLIDLLNAVYFLLQKQAFVTPILTFRKILNFDSNNIICFETYIWTQTDEWKYIQLAASLMSIDQVE